MWYFALSANSISSIYVVVDLLYYKLYNLLYNKSTTSRHSAIHDLPLNHVTNYVIMLSRKLSIFAMSSEPTKVVGLITATHCFTEMQTVN